MKYLDYQEHRQQGTEDFPIAYYYVEESMPRYYMTYHWHPEYEIIRILDGIFQMTVNHTNYTLEQGDIIFIQDGMLHGGNPLNCVYECLVFDMTPLIRNNRICRNQVEQILNHKIYIHPQLPDDDSEITSTISTLFEAMQKHKTGYEFVVQGSLYQLLGMLLEKQLYSIRPKNELQVTDRLKHLKYVLRYIEGNYTEDIKLEDLASIAGMNPKYFCRFFKQITQKTPISYLNYYRIECAIEQLFTTDASITEVAFNCGFNDISYFIRTFKKHKGITPKQYIKQMHETRIGV